MNLAMGNLSFNNKIKSHKIATSCIIKLHLTFSIKDVFFQNYKVDILSEKVFNKNGIIKGFFFLFFFKVLLYIFYVKVKKKKRLYHQWQKYN